MKIEMWKLNDVKPYDKNPRINDAAVDSVSASIKEFGFRQPLVVDKDGVIIIGHTRWKAAQKLGLEKLPVHVAELPEDKARALRIADNKLHELSEWNFDLLPLELKDLQNAEFNIDLLGFGSEELEKLLGAGISGNPGLTDPDSIPAPPDEPITRPGDLWILGDHRLMCGDASKPEVIDRLMNGNKAQMTNCDPPYNVRVEPRSNNAIAAGLSSFGEPGIKNHQGFDVARDKTKAQGTTKKLRAKDRPLANDFVSDGEFDRLLRAWFGNISRVLEPGRAFYIWGGYANLANYPSALKECELYFSQAIVWDKQHPVLTRKDFMGAFELCQPPDTKVLTPDGYSSIKALNNDDRVVSFAQRSNAMVGLRHGNSVRTTSRSYRGSLYGIVVGDRTTWCTDGHIWTVRMTPDAHMKWCVYLMRRGAWWRVGMSKVYTTWGLGVKQRLEKEGGDEVWILSIHSTRQEASLEESIISNVYGIPQCVWTKSRSSVRTEGMIKRIYDRLNLDLIETSARKLLSDFNRSIFSPFVTSAMTREKYGTRVTNLIRACNILPEIMAVPVPGKGQEYSWLPVRAVDVQEYEGPVYSMGVEKYHHYVADGIVTHNCFYGWREGAAHYFTPEINNATDLWHIKKVSPQNMCHLTQKPVELAERAMLYSSRPGENVLDLFGGSGSTLIGAEKTGRRAFLTELDPLYCDVICDRFQRYSGKPAVLERTGASPIPMKPREENMR